MQVFLDKVKAKEKYFNSVYNSFLSLKTQLNLENKSIKIAEQLLTYYWMKVFKKIIFIYLFT